jgi:hypothetical protein
MKSFLCIATVAFIATFLGSACSYAQVSSAQISGVVTDSSGAALPNAEALIVSKDTGATRKVRSEASGEFNAPALDPGHYRITISAPGFETFNTEGVVLTIGEKKSLTFALMIGKAEQTVTVSGSEAMINNTSGEISQVIGQRAITELPLNGRDPSSLVLLTTGVTNVLTSPIGLIPGGTAFPTETNASAGGGRQGSTFYLLDGSPNMDTYLPAAAPFPNSDATQEFRVLSNNFDARYGYAPGAVVSIQTRSGSNAFHGGAFEFLRNNALNAADYFSHNVDSLKRNQFGGYLGGPVLKDRIFFFANYQGTRASTAAESNVAYTPTQAMLNGDFSAVPMPLTGGFATINGKPNQINPALFSPAAVTITKTALPLGQDPATGQINFSQPGSRTSYDEGTARLDFNINANQRLFLRSFTQFLDTAGSAVNGNLMAIIAAKPGRDYNLVLGHSWVINQKTINEASVFWTELAVNSEATPRDSSGNAFCMSKYIAVNDIPGHCYLEGLSVQNGFSSGYNAFQSEFRRSFGFNDDLTRTIGKHNLTVGGNLWRQFAQENADYPAAPIVGFSNLYTGFGLADFLLGHVNNFEQGGGEIASVKGWQLGLFAQDQYRVAPNFTVTAGLRWDPNLPPASQGARGAAFRPGQQSQRFPNAPLGLVFPGDPGVDDALMPTTYNYFQPRIGFSWQPNGLPHTAVRGGFGFFTGPIPYSTYNHAADIAPFSPTFNLNANPATGYNIPFDAPWSTFTGTGGQSPFPPFASVGYQPPANSIFQTPVSLGAVFAPNFRASMTESWNVSVDQQFAGDIALHLAYVGSESYHMATIIDNNPGIYANAGQRTTYPLFGNILTETSLGTSPYHSLQVSLEKRFSHGLEARSNFTWSKVMDLSATGNLAVQGGLPNPFNIRFNRGISQLNVPFVSTTNFVYVSPSLDHWTRATRQFLGNWELSAIVTLQSGQPFGISGGQNGNNNSGSLQDGDRADSVPGVIPQVHQGTRQNWLNHYVSAGAFQPNAPGTFGNTARNPFVGPGISTTDASLAKNWKFEHGYNFQFRWEMFNAFNHTSFGLPNTDPTSSNFGQITNIGAISPRVMQAGAKLTF